MDKNKRIEQLIITLCVFISGFLIYGLIGSKEALISENKITSFLVYGLLGGFSISMVLHAIIIAINFFNKKSMKFKIIASILWPVTILVLFYTSIVCYIPHQIYNIIKIIKEKR